jgi:hypothetical protein
MRPQIHQIQSPKKMSLRFTWRKRLCETVRLTTGKIDTGKTTRFLDVFFDNYAVSWKKIQHINPLICKVRTAGSEKR